MDVLERVWASTRFDFLTWREKVRAEPGSCFRRQKAWSLPAALAGCAFGAWADFAWG
jgi:hypothetical protein